MIWWLTVAALVFAVGGFTYRLLRGPTLADRIVGFDGVLAVFVIALLADAVRSRSPAMLPVVLVLTLLAFASTALLGRYIEAGGDDD